MNYTLTTDLIADCMALIPSNLERLNGSQDYFTIYKSPKDVYYNWENEPHSLTYKQCENYHKFIIIFHCLKTIPEFQVEIKGDVIIDDKPFFVGDTLLYSEPARFTNYLVIFDYNYKKHRLLDLDNDVIWDVEDINTHWGEWVDWWKVELVQKGIKPQTIASATLHGQGEFPPSTLEELCESYKNVMEK